MSATHSKRPHNESVPSNIAFMAMCRKRGINPDGQFAEEDGYLFYDGYEAGVHDTHKLCNVEETVIALHKAQAELKALREAAQAVISDALDDAESLVHVCDAQNDDIKARKLSPSGQKLYQVLKNEPA